MQEKSFANHKRVQVAMLLLNVVPLLHAVSVLACFFIPGSWLYRLGLALVLLYIVPVIFGRVLRESLRASSPNISINSSDFLRWWCCFQCQVLFLRFPFLEEVLRLVPGLYSLWLRAWGSRIGKFTYWPPQITILDRGFLEIGDHVIFGAGVKLNPHVMEKESEPLLRLAPIRIGHHAVIGGYSLLTAGTEISEGEATRAFLISPPFSKWQNGKRIRTSL